MFDQFSYTFESNSSTKNLTVCRGRFTSILKLILYYTEAELKVSVLSIHQEIIDHWPNYICIGILHFVPNVVLMPLFFGKLLVKYKSWVLEWKGWSLSLLSIKHFKWLVVIKIELMGKRNLLIFSIFREYQGLLYHRTCKPDFLCSWPSLNSYLK